MNYAAKAVVHNQWLLLAAGLFLLALIYFALSRTARSLRLSVSVFAGGLLFLCVQIFMVLSYWFQPGWDPGAIIYLSKELALGLPLEAYSLSQYPNNSLLALFFSGFYQLALSRNLPELFAYKAILIFQCFLSFAAGQLSFHSAKCLTKDDRTAALAFILYLLLVGLSPWVSIPYSDSIALPLPICILALYVWRPRRYHWLPPVLMGFTAYIGYNIKPTVMIVFIAVCICEVFYALETGKLRSLLGTVLPAALGLAVGLAVYSLIISASGILIDKEQTLGASHFLNMGLNEETMGVYNQEDVNFSLAFDSAEERRQANLESAGSRVQEMGPVRMLRHLVRKILCTYNDGSFAWGQEGYFIVQLQEITDPVISPFIRSIYYPDGENHLLFLGFEQAVWLAVLALSCFSVFSHRSRGLSVLMLTLSGLLLYFLLFEVRARYLYIFAPLYIVLAVSAVPGAAQCFAAAGSHRRAPEVPPREHN